MLSDNIVIAAEVYCLDEQQRRGQQARGNWPAASLYQQEAHYDALQQLLNDLPRNKVYAGKGPSTDCSPIDMVLAAIWLVFRGLFRR